MSISDRTRKIIWMKSGSRCAICRNPLSIDETSLDADSIIGDECHIRSGKPTGPRFEADFPTEMIDSDLNLIILCKIHHKMIDDQFETYTTELLLSIKKNHEAWINSRLSVEEPIPRSKIVRYKNEIPKSLPRIENGKDLLDLSLPCMSMYHDYPSDLDAEETELVASFVQSIRDWNDIGSSLEPGDIIRASKSISDEMNELRIKQFEIFGAIEKQTLVSDNMEDANWRAFHLSILRSSDTRIISVSNSDK